MQKGKYFPEKAWQRAEEREVKSKEERERYAQLNPEFQRIARRKEDFLKLKKKNKKKNKNKTKQKKTSKEIKDN